MTVRPVVRLPEAVLTAVAKPVDLIDDGARQLAADLIDTMRASPGCVGLAAPQIGVGLRAFSVDVTGHRKARSCHGEFVLFNPEILVADGPITGREGCMSVPDLTGDVARATHPGWWRGLTPAGAERVLEVDAFEARAVLHEIDHLDGLTFLDVARRRARRRLPAQGLPDEPGADRRPAPTRSSPSDSIGPTAAENVRDGEGQEGIERHVKSCRTPHLLSIVGARRR